MEAWQDGPRGPGGSGGHRPSGPSVGHTGRTSPALLGGGRGEWTQNSCILSGVSRALGRGAQNRPRGPGGGGGHRTSGPQCVGHRDQTSLSLVGVMGPQALSLRGTLLSLVGSPHWHMRVGWVVGGDPARTEQISPAGP